MKIVLALVLVGLAFGDDDCHRQMTAVSDCVQKKHEQNKAADDAKIEKAKADAGKCLTQVGCDAPDYDSKGGMGGEMAKQWENQPEAVKECIKKDFKTTALAKLNECLSKNRVNQIQPAEMDDHDVFGDRNIADGEKIGKNLMAIAMALKKCEKAHPDQAKGVISCLAAIKEKFFADVCKRINDCKAEVKVGDSCRKRGQEIKDAVCKCKVEKMKEAKAKIEQLQQKGGDVDADDIKGLNGDEHGGMEGINFDHIEKCYKDNNANPPAILGMAKNLQGGGSGGGLLGLFKQGKPKITQEQLKAMHEAVEEKIRDPECGC